MDYPLFIISNQYEETISIQMVKQVGDSDKMWGLPSIL